ncbi:ferrous iron transport protein A [Enterocloster clostridioformis]|uniref:FeoA family protein n=1 Tax=Enterocloster clostridioformis TaxID=1531 RepID=UPI00080CB7EF|nr:FeoA family protein [Enterocloster clostridioformis]ANU47901.1 ferrous iron transport protein A [Lachnoclostridium sp. YL32]NDO29806.1 ferrous iron transport protein A [Enterocloster clostridioformis]OXE69381.1 ferrous iron transport protein A [Enterocloster clostridioformis]QQR03202.1 ferrous iron transport protein A [Enterocloster clostridioformis]
MVYPLHELKPGERAEIVWVISEPPMSLRLEELGFTAAAQVTCILKGRRGHMSAYQIQGTVIALRPQNAREVLVRILNPG